MAAKMTTAGVLRIFICLHAQPQSCEWTLRGGTGKSLRGKGLLTELPGNCDDVEVVLAAADVLFISQKLPGSARRHSAAVLSFAVEEATAGEPENSEVSLIGTDAAGRSILAVVDKPALLQWRTALAAAGVSEFTLTCETLLLPWTPGCWSLAWNGTEGFVRTGRAAGCVTDRATDNKPPLALQLLVDSARTEGDLPAQIHLYMTSDAAVPDVLAWSQALGIDVQAAGNWQRDGDVVEAGPVLARPRQRWQLFTGMGVRLRPACWILAISLALHGLVSVAQWNALSGEQQELRAQMELRFRSVFPEAVAVMDPVLQMRRQLASARQAAGTVDSSDFLPMLERVALATSAVPAGGLLLLDYGSDRLMLEYSGAAMLDITSMRESLVQSGLVAEIRPPATDNTRVVLVVRSR